MCVSFDYIEETKQMKRTNKYTERQSHEINLRHLVN